MSNESIRVGDRFQTASGMEWIVTRTRPGGVCEMVNPARTMSCEKYTRDVRRMTRLEGTDTKAVRMAQLFAGC